jgi:hypothetical protein
MNTISIIPIGISIVYFLFYIISERNSIKENFEQGVKNKHLVCKNDNEFMVFKNADATCYPMECLENDVFYMKREENTRLYNIEKINRTAILFKLISGKRFNDRNEDLTCSNTYDKKVVYENHKKEYIDANTIKLNETRIRGASYIDVSNDILKTDDSLTNVDELVCRRGTQDQRDKEIININTVIYKKFFVLDLNTRKYRPLFVNLDHMALQDKSSVEYIVIEQFDTIDGLKEKYCHISCADIPNKADYWREENNATFSRVNYVDNEEKTACILNESDLLSTPQVLQKSYKCFKEDLNALSYGVDEFHPVLTDNDNVYSFQNDNNENYDNNYCKTICAPDFKKETDNCVKEYLTNQTDIWYDTNNKIHTFTTCKVNFYISKWPEKTFIDGDNKWYYNSDITCAPLIPLNRVVSINLKFIFPTIQIFNNALNIIPILNERPEDFLGSMTCEKIYLDYTLHYMQPGDQIILLIRKRNKEIILKHIISSNGKVVKKKFDNDLDKNTTFTPRENNFSFKLYNNDFHNLEFSLINDIVGLPVTDSTPQLSSLKIEMVCSQEQTRLLNHVDATHITTIGSNASYAPKDLKSCNYDSEYYSNIESVTCNEYTECEFPTDKKDLISDENRFCYDINNYVNSQNIDYPIIKTHNKLNLNSHNDCAQKCDEHYGCLGINFDDKFKNCILHGFQTKILTIETNVLNVSLKFYNINNDTNEKKQITNYTQNRRNNILTHIFVTPQYIENIVIKLSNENELTDRDFINIELFDFKGTLQNSFHTNASFDNTKKQIKNYSTSDFEYTIDGLYVE